MVSQSNDSVETENRCVELMVDRKREYFYMKWMQYALVEK